MADRKTAAPRRRPRTAAALAVASAALASVAVAPSAEAREAPLSRTAAPDPGVTSSTANSTATTGSFRVGHLNILYKLPHDKFVHDLRLVTSRADVVGLNEVSRRRDYLQKWADRNGWHFYAPGPRAAADNAMLARKSAFRVVGRGSQFVADTGGEGTPPPPRYNNWVRYEHRATGVDLFHIGTHLNSHIDNAGHPYDLPRTRDAEKHIRMVKELTDRFRAHGQVVVTGDFNVDYVADRRVQYRNFPYTVLEERQRAGSLPGLRSSYSLHGVKDEGTHGRRHIDYVYLWQRERAYRTTSMTGYSVVEGTYSDHDAVVAGFRIVK